MNFSVLTHFNEPHFRRSYDGAFVSKLHPHVKYVSTLRFASYLKYYLLNGELGIHQQQFIASNIFPESFLKFVLGVHLYTVMHACQYFVLSFHRSLMNNC